MTRYYTSDLHFQHARIIELCDRPFKDVDHMDSAIIDNFNSILNPLRDDLHILGDICMGQMEKSLKNLGRIRARRIFMYPGNHDRWSLAYHTKGDHATKRASWQERYRLAVHPLTTEVVVCTDKQPSQWRGSAHEAYVTLSHYPWEGDSHDSDRYVPFRPTHKAGFLIHGHVHNAWRTRGRMFNVGVDVNDFKPVSEIVIRDWMGDVLNGVDITGEEKRLAVEDLYHPRFARTMVSP